MTHSQEPNTPVDATDLERYRLFFEQSPDGVFVANTDGHYTQVNPAACRLTGYTAAELCGMRVIDVLHPTDHARAMAHFMRCMSQGIAVDDIHFVRKNGEVGIWTVKAVKINEQLLVGFAHDITEKERMEQALLESERRLSFALDAVNDGVWDWNLVTNEAYFSPEYYRMLGYAPDEFEGSYKMWRQLVHPHDLPLVEPVIAQAVENKSQFDFEFRMKKKSGEWLWIRARGRVMGFDETGKPIRMVGTHTDISLEKAVEEALQASQERLLRAERVAKSGNWEFHMKSGMLNASDGAVAIYGLTNPVMPIKEVQQFPLPEYRAMLDEALRGLVQGKKPYDVQFKIHNPITRQVVDIHSIAEYDPVEEIVFGVIQDITETRKAQEALERIEWMLQQGSEYADAIGGLDLLPAYGDLTALNRDGIILSHVGKEVLEAISGDYLDLLQTSSAIYELNGDYALGIFSSGWCQYMDRASRRLCGECSNQEALTSGAWLCHESCWKDTSLAAMQSRQPVDIECTGGIHLYAIPIWVNGEVAGAINFGYGDPPRDTDKLAELAQLYRVDAAHLARLAERYESRPPFIIDLAKKRLAVSAQLIGALVERSLAEEALLALNSALEQRVSERTAALQASTEEMEAFIYSVSHDLRAPLRAVDGYSGMLVETYQNHLDETALRYLQTVRANAHRMDLLITELLALSRITRAEMKTTLVNMEELVQREMAEVFAQDLRGECALTVDSLPRVRGDAVLLRQVWHNLIDNAIKYTRQRENPCIRIQGWKEPGRVVYSVADNGIGFDAAYVEKLFGVFQRLHTQAEIEGTGIGLAIVERIIKRHGGGVWAEGKEGEGATFFFALPDAA